MNYIVLLGGNIGDREGFLASSIEELAVRCGKVTKTSMLYETKAWGVEDQQDFLNQVVEVNSNLDPKDFLNTILTIEKDLGRVRYRKWGERVIDIDILFVENQVIDTKELKVPHPFLHYRRFTLTPLVELFPDFIHPVFNKSNKELLNDCSDPLTVKKL